MGKGKVLHVIDTLNTGGAEILLKNLVNTLAEWQHVVVYLSPPDILIKEFKGDVCFVCINHKGWRSTWQSIFRLRAVIKKYNPVLVHSNLLISSTIARLATPAKIPLINSIHSVYSADAFEKGRKSLWSERVTLRKRHTLVAVSDFVLQDYLANVPFRGQRFILYNFLPDHHFTKMAERKSKGHLRCVAVGSLKEAKNYTYLLDIFSQLPNRLVQLDIFGEGPLREPLQKRINEQNLPVVLKGQHDNSTAFLKEYDLFVQASNHEGFGLSVIEAMAAGLPVFLSDIPVFREITAGQAHFFPLRKANEAAQLLMQLQQNTEKRTAFIYAAYEWCRNQYNAAAYKAKLVDIYNNVITKR